MIPTKLVDLLFSHRRLEFWVWRVDKSGPMSYNNWLNTHSSSICLRRQHCVAASLHRIIVASANHSAICCSILILCFICEFCWSSRKKTVLGKPGRGAHFGNRFRDLLDPSGELIESVFEPIGATRFLYKRNPFLIPIPFSYLVSHESPLWTQNAQNFFKHFWMFERQKLNAIQTKTRFFYQHSLL